MKPLLPLFARFLGYGVIALGLFLPFLLYMFGMVNDHNLLLYKECSKLLMMFGALMILFAIRKNECAEMLTLRNKAARNAMFFTVFFVFGTMLYRVYQGNLMNVDSSSFLTFLLVNVICQEYLIKKAEVDAAFKR